MLVAVLGLATIAAGAHARTPGGFEVFRRSDASTERTVREARAPGRFAVTDVDAGAVRRFRGARGGTVRLPIGAGAELELTLRSFEIFAPQATITSTGPAGPAAVLPDIELFRGAVVGQPRSWAVLAFSGTGVMGTVESRGRRYTIAPLPGTKRAGALPAHVIVAEADLVAPSRPFRCFADELPTIEIETPPAPAFPQVTPDRLVCDLAVDCDYELYAYKYGSNVTEAMSYVITLIGTVSAIYERDLNVALRMTYLNLWTTSDDPYTVPESTPQLLTEFRNWWDANQDTVPRHLAHLVSGRDLGGGVGFLGGLCNTSLNYGLSRVDAYNVYPTNSTTWDIEVIAHELGHNFNSRHTHHCFWQANGYAAPGALLDSCYTAEGSCYSGPTGILPPDKGTIMSYCQVVAGDTNGVRLDFHPACIAVMRPHAEACLPVAALQPPRALAATGGADTVELSWAASPSPGVLRYDVHRSAVQLDLDPIWIGSTTGTTFADDGRIGTWYYKVRGIRAADSSGFSNEVETTACLPAAPICSDIGRSVRPPVVDDFDEDGIADLAALSEGLVSVVLGQGGGGVGNGRFGMPVSYPAGANPFGTTVADFDEDGIRDLAVVNFLPEGKVSVLLGQGAAGVGDGTFAAPVAYAAGDHPVALTRGDFDEDGIVDLAVCNLITGISILLGGGADGVGDGTFEAPQGFPVGVQPSAITTGDFNEDGIVDLATATTGSRELSVLLGQGTGGVGNGAFSTAVNYSTPFAAVGIVASDFDQDGITDLAVAGSALENGVAVLRGAGVAGTGDGTFGPAIFQRLTARPEALAAGDLNGDGRADLAVATDDGLMAFLLCLGDSGAGDRVFDAEQRFTADSMVVGIVIGDFVEDGLPDLALLHGESAGRVCVVPGRCSAGESTVLTLQAPNGGESWAPGTEQVIAWTKGEGVLAVNVECSRDGGITWEPIAERQTGNQFTWSVSYPTTGSATALVGIYDPTVPSRADPSDAPFTIVPAPSDVSGAARPRLVLVVANPAHRRLVLTVSLPSGEAARLDLLDVSGRTLRSLDLGSRGAGRHVVDLDGRWLPSGIYFVRLRQGRAEATARAAFVR